MSSGDSEASAGGAPAVSPVVISDQELTVISVHSSDTDPDSSEEDCLSHSRNKSTSPVPADVHGEVLESPSHYPTPAEPVELSSVSSVLISPNRDRENCSSGSLDMNPVFEVSPDTTGLVQATVPGGPASSAVSLPPTGAESLPPMMIDGAISYNLSLVDPGSDVSLLAFPIYPLPACMVLMPMLPSDQPSTSPDRPSQREHRFRAVCSSCDLSREGPFDAYCAPLDTGDHPLGVQRPAGLPLSYDVLRRNGCCRCGSGVRH